MEVKTDTYDVGVIVGRFQVPELHNGHIDLINSVLQRHDKVLIFLGLSPLMVTAENPLDFESRKQMLLEKFPTVNVLYIKDTHSDQLWSKSLDQMIDDVCTPGQTVVLYGSRDSFISHYEGRFPTQELVQQSFFSGRETRKAIARKSTKASADFRAGVVWASQGRFPTAYTTVDIAIFSENGDKILLGRKANEDKYRLIGGFSDPRSESFEQDARREVMEETHVEITDPEYISSAKVDDWRYRNEVDCIKTLLFKAKYQSGKPRPDDDIAEVKWFKITPGNSSRDCTLDNFCLEDTVVSNHIKLVEMAVNA